MLCTHFHCEDRDHSNKFLVIIAYAQISPSNANADVSSGTTGMIFVRVFIFIHILCMRAAKTLTSLCICAGSPVASLFHKEFMSWPKSIILETEGCGFEPHRRYYVVSLSKTLTLLSLLSSGSTQSDTFRHN